MASKYPQWLSKLLYRHVFNKISTEFRGILHVFANFADLPEFRGSATTRNIRSPDIDCVLNCIFII